MEERTNLDEMAKTLVIYKIDENAQKSLDILLGKCYTNNVRDDNKPTTKII